METTIFTETNQAALIIFSGVGLMLIMGITLLLFFIFSKKKIVQKELEKKDLELQHSRKLLEATIGAQEKERERIARDLHDDISSKLNVVSLNCHLLTMDRLEKDKEAEIVNGIIEMASKALENSRKIAHNLFPPVFDKFGLHAAIEELCEEFSSVKNLSINYNNTVRFSDDERERHIHVFRIVQELMNNSLRHGKASAIEILFRDIDAKTFCFYKDNGNGFDAANHQNSKGLGMKNIESRINFLNGSLTVDSAEGKGSNFVFSF